MGYEQSIIDQILLNFDFGYMVTINALTYIIIKLIEELNGVKVMSTWMKRLVLVIVIAMLTMVYLFTGYSQYTVLINSACAAPVLWSWVLKPLATKIGINYKK